MLASSGQTEKIPDFIKLLFLDTFLEKKHVNTQLRRHHRLRSRLLESTSGQSLCGLCTFSHKADSVMLFKCKSDPASILFQNSHMQNKNQTPYHGLWDLKRSGSPPYPSSPIPAAPCLLTSLPRLQPAPTLGPTRCSLCLEHSSLSLHMLSLHWNPCSKVSSDHCVE